MKSIFVAIVIMFLVLLFAGMRFSSSYYNSNYNAWWGISSNECSSLTNPQSTTDFLSQMFNLNSNSGNQWSTQMNAGPAKNSLGGGVGVDFAQYNEAISSSGTVYGAVEYILDNQHDLINVHSSNLATPGGISSKDEFYIEVFTNSNHYVYKAEFFYYENSIGHLYGPQTVTISSSDYLALYAWELNIVGENGGSSPYADFSSGEFGTIYYSMSSGSFTTLSGEPSCTQNCCWTTSETSNIYYGVPSVSGESGSQSYDSN